MIPWYFILIKTSLLSYFWKFRPSCSPGPGQSLHPSSFWTDWLCWKTAVDCSTTTVRLALVAGLRWSMQSGLLSALQVENIKRISCYIHVKSCQQSAIRVSPKRAVLTTTPPPRAPPRQHHHHQHHNAAKPPPAAAAAGNRRPKGS